MNSRQRRTLRAVLSEPVPADLRWRDIESLFRALGGVVEEAAGSRVTVVLNELPAVFHRPHPRPEAKRSTVRAVRRFLVQAGVRARSESQ